MCVYLLELNEGCSIAQKQSTLAAMQVADMP